MCVIKMLVVEDDSTLRDIYKFYLPRVFAPEELLFASDFYSAKEIIEKEKPSLYLLDICLRSDKTGFDLLPIIKENVPFNIIAMASALQDNKTYIEVIESNVDKFFDKPTEHRKVVEYFTIKKEVVKRWYEHDRFAEMARHGFITDTTPMGIVITNTDGIIEYANKNICEQTGYSLEELVGQKTSIFKSGYHDELFYKSLWETVLSGDTFHADVMCNKRKNGTLYWEEIKIIPEKADGKIVNFIAYKRDVTRFREMSIELESVIEATKSLIFILDKDYKFIRHYPKVSDEFFTEPEEFLEKSIFEVFPNDMSDKFYENLIHIKEFKKPRIINYTVGEEYWEATLSPYNSNKFIVVCQNVSEREDYITMKKALEAIQRNNAELRKAFSNQTPDLIDGEARD